MAEFGALLNPGDGPAPRIDVDMLDYEYVRNCSDWRMLNAILEVLKSGKEGFYPDVSTSLLHLIAY